MRKRLLRGLVAIAAGLGSLAVLSSPAEAVDIVSGGPLSKVATSTTLNCDVQHVSDVTPSFFGGTACGTFVAVQETLGTPGNLYGPGLIPGYNLADTAWTPVDQVVTGTGTEADPFTIVTTVSGDGNITVVQTDTYVTGDESYRTDITVTNNAAGPRDLIIYRGGDCDYNGSDDGFGEPTLVPTLGAYAITCTDSPDPGGRIIQWIPLSGDSRFRHGTYFDVWSGISNQEVFADECDLCGVASDNAAALGWVESEVATGASVTVSHLTVFSPGGVSPLDAQVTITTPADGATYELGAAIPADYGCVPYPGATILDLTGTVPDGDDIDTSTVGVHEFEVTCDTDFGAPVTETVSYTVEDTTDPTITIAAPIDGGTYYPGEEVLADYTCTDADIDTCEGDVPTGTPIDTSVGDHTFTVTATDESGNESELTVSYTVLPLPGVCRARTIGLLNQTIGKANLPGDPCVTRDNNNIQSFTTTFGPTLPPLLSKLNNTITVGLVSASTFSTPTTAFAQSHVASVRISVPSIGLVIELAGIESAVAADLTPGCGNLAPVGASKIASLRINGLRTTPPAGPQSSIALPGVGGIHFNQKVFVDGVMTQRAFFLDLPGTALDVVLGEATAGGFCPPPAP